MTARILRILGAALVACTLSTTAASAGVITSILHGDAHLDYGGPHAQYYAVNLYWPTADGSLLLSNVSITTGPLTATSFTPGTSIYQYAGGGSLSMGFNDGSDGGFEAQVLDLTVTVRESTGLEYAEVMAAFRLGAGLLDAPAAAALGIGQRTSGGSLVDPWLVGLDGPTDVERYAQDGAATVTLDTVPEPSLLALLALGVGMSTPLIARRARSRRRT